MNAEVSGLDCFDKLSQINTINDPEEVTEVGDGVRKFRSLAVNEESSTPPQFIFNGPIKKPGLLYNRGAFIEITIAGGKVKFDTRRVSQKFFRTFQEPVFFWVRKTCGVTNALYCTGVSNYWVVKNYTNTQINRSSVNMSSLASLYNTVKKSKYIKCMEHPEQVVNPSNCLRKLQLFKMSVTDSILPINERRKNMCSPQAHLIVKYVEDVQNFLPFNEFNDKWKYQNSYGMTKVVKRDGHKSKLSAIRQSIINERKFRFYQSCQQKLPTKEAMKPTIFVRKDLFQLKSAPFSNNAPQMSPQQLQCVINCGKIGNTRQLVFKQRIPIRKPNPMDLVGNTKSVASQIISKWPPSRVIVIPTSTTTVRPQVRDDLRSAVQASDDHRPSVQAPDGHRPVVLIHDDRRPEVQESDVCRPEVQASVDQRRAVQASVDHPPAVQAPDGHRPVVPNHDNRRPEVQESDVCRPEVQASVDQRPAVQAKFKPRSHYKSAPRSKQIDSTHRVKVRADMECLLNNILYGKRRSQDVMAQKTTFVDGVLKFKENYFDRDRVENVRVLVKSLTAKEILRIQHKLKNKN